MGFRALDSDSMPKSLSTTSAAQSCLLHFRGLFKGFMETSNATTRAVFFTASSTNFHITGLSVRKKNKVMDPSGAKCSGTINLT